MRFAIPTIRTEHMIVELSWSSLRCVVLQGKENPVELCRFLQSIALIHDLQQSMNFTLKREISFFLSFVMLPLSEKNPFGECQNHSSLCYWWYCS